MLNNKNQRQSTLLQYILFCSISISFLYFFTSFSGEIKPYILSAFIVIATYLYYVLFFLYTRKEDWHSPFSLGFGLLTLYSVGGIIVYELREIYWFNYPADMEVASKSVVLAHIFMLTGRLISAPLIKFVPYEVIKLEFNLKKLYLVIVIFTIVGNFAAMLLYDFYRNVPIFSENIDVARQQLREYSAGRGTLFILQQVLVISVPLSYYYFRFNRHKTRLVEFVILSVACLIPLSFYGGRFFILVPVVLLVITQSVYFKQVKFSVVIGSSVFLLAFAMAFIAYRSFGNDVNSYYATRAIWSDFFPEVRSFAFVVSELGEPRIYKEIFYNFVSTMFPSVLLSFLGIEKKFLLFSIGDFVASATGFNLPIRTGLIGEAYLAYGFTGVSIIFGVLGFVLGFLHRAFEKISRSDARRFIIIVSSTFLALMIPYGTNMLSTTIFATIFASFAVWTCSYNRNRNSKLRY